MEKYFVESSMDLQYVDLYEYPDGSAYRGQMINNLRHGYGEMYWIDANYYVGHWENDQMEGIGKQIIPVQMVDEISAK